jgi:hypothetical protein
MARPRATHPANAPSEAEFAAAISSIEKIKADLESEHMEYMRRCRPFHLEIKRIVDGAKAESGIRPRVLKGEVKRREHLKKAGEVGEKFEDEDAAQFDYVRKLFGDAADLGLFAHAADAAEQHARETVKKGRKRKSADDVAAEKRAEFDGIVAGDDTPF